MAKLTINDITSGYFSTSALNAAFTAIETAIENTVSRDGTTPNQMTADLDMNSNRVTNLPEPITDNEAARRIDVQNAISGATANLIGFTPYGNIVATNIQGAIQEEVDDLASSSGSALVGFIQTGTGAVATTLQAALRLTQITPEHFGATGDGVADDTAKLLAAHTYAASVSRPLHLKPGATYLVGAGGSFDIDVSKTNWVCDGHCSIQWSAAPTAGYGVKVIGPASYDYTTRHKDIRAPLSGISLLGGTSGAKYAAIALQVGDATIDNTSMLLFRDGAIQGWDTEIEFKDNTWGIGFDNWQLMWGNIVTPAAPSNFGATMSFKNVQFLDGGELQLYTGSWFFFGCAIQSKKLRVLDDAVVIWNGGHFENGSTETTPTWGTVEGANGSLIIDGASLVLVNPGANITTPLFDVADTNTDRGLILDNISMAQLEQFRPDTGAEARLVVVGGEGRVQVGRWMSNVLSNFFYYAIAAGAGAFRNYNFEAATLEGWTSSGTGTAAVDAVTFKNGAQAAKLTATVGNNIAIRQDCRVLPGETAYGGFWTKSDLTTGAATGDVTWSALWLDEAGSTISTAASGTVSATADWNWQRIGGIAPKGAAFLSFQIATSVTAGTMYAWIDDVIVTVCK